VRCLLTKGIKKIIIIFSFLFFLHTQLEDIALVGNADRGLVRGLLALEQLAGSELLLKDKLLVGLESLAVEACLVLAIELLEDLGGGLEGGNALRPLNFLPVTLGLLAGAGTPLEEELALEQTEGNLEDGRGVLGQLGPQDLVVLASEVAADLGLDLDGCSLLLEVALAVDERLGVLRDLGNGGTHLLELFRVVVRQEARLDGRCERVLLLVTALLELEERQGVADKHLGLSELVLLVDCFYILFQYLGINTQHSKITETLRLENVGTAITGVTLEVWPGLLGKHLVTLEEFFVLLAVAETSAFDTDVLQKTKIASLVTAEILLERVGSLAVVGLDAADIVRVLLLLLGCLF